MLPVRARATVLGAVLCLLSCAPIAHAATTSHSSPSTRSKVTASAIGVPKAPLTEWGLSTIGATTAWALGAQGQGITVAIVDSGANLSQRDLAPNLWTNPNEIPGNGIDDDGDGIADDVHGADFVSATGTPADANGHGTHVAGIVAGSCIAICGVAPKAKLMIVRVLDASASGDSSTVAEGIDYAADHGARIINLSLSGPDADASLQAAITHAQTLGAIVVAAAGNSAQNVDTVASYPASYSAPNLMSVAAVDINGRLGAESDYGSHTVTLAAPGQGILSTSITGGTEWRTGTSMAAPMVAGALADLWSLRPSLTWQQVEGLVTSTATRGLPVISGSLNLGAAANSLAGVKKTNAKKTSKSKRRTTKSATR